VLTKSEKEGLAWFQNKLKKLDEVNTILFA
jgi:hypothetical protein